MWCGVDLGPTTEADVAAPPSTLAKAAAEEIYEVGKYDLSPEQAKAQIAAIIERCLAGGGDTNNNTQR